MKSVNTKGDPRHFIAYISKDTPIKNFTAFTDGNGNPLKEMTMHQNLDGSFVEMYPHKVHLGEFSFWVFTAEGVDPQECISHTFRARLPGGFS